MCEVPTMATCSELVDGVSRVRQRVEDLRLENPRMYAALQPLLADLVQWMDSASRRITTLQIQIDHKKRG